MKSASKVFLCMILLSSCFPLVYARDIILIENLADGQSGLLLQNILIKKFHLPRELMTLKNISDACEAKTEAIIHLCLQKDGTLQVKKFNDYVVKNSLGVFLNQTGSEEIKE
jgi:hypothetical protein